MPALQLQLQLVFKLSSAASKDYWSSLQKKKRKRKKKIL